MDIAPFRIEQYYAVHEFTAPHMLSFADRSRAIVLSNLELVDAFLVRHADRFSWARPNASTIGFVRVEGVEDTSPFCEQLVADAGVLLLPGTVYDEPTHVRLGFGRSSMPEALGLFEAWIETRS